MGVGTTNLGVVFIHGLFSSEKTWDPLAGILKSDVESDVEELDFVTVRRFDYASPKLQRFRPDRRTADYNDLADQLKAFLQYEAAEHDRLLLVAHSQGGLIVQRYLARMIGSGRGQELSKIRGVMLFACPNDGSDFMLPLRSAWWSGHPQVRALAPLDPDVKDAQRTVLNQIVNAKGVGASRCHIPFRVFGGSEDKVVVRASAQGVFPDVSMLPGDHFSIIQPKTREDAVYVALRDRLLEVQQQEDPAAPGTVASMPGEEPIIVTATNSRLPELTVTVDDDPPRRITNSDEDHFIHLQARTTEAVTLMAMRAVVVARRPPRRACSLPQYSRACSSVVMRTFVADFDKDPSNLDALGEDFPFMISSTEVEMFNIRPHSDTDEVSWRFEIDWIHLGCRGTTVVDDGGKPFEVYPTHMLRRNPNLEWCSRYSLARHLPGCPTGRV